MKKMVLVMVFGFFAAMHATAERAFVYGKIDHILMTSDGSFGGCMVHLTQINETLSGGASTAAILPECKADWVSLSCSGGYANKADARFLLQNAQLAVALNKLVKVRMDNTKLHNTQYCFADFIQTYDDPS